MSSGSSHESLEVFSVQRRDLVPVDREQHDPGVDDVGEASGSQQLTCRSAEWLIEGTDIDASKSLRQASLTPTATPHLSENAGVGDG